MDNEKLIDRASVEAQLLHTLAEMLDAQFKEAENAKIRAGLPEQNRNTAKTNEQKRVYRSMAQVGRQYAILTNTNEGDLNDGCQELAKYFRALLLLVIDRSLKNEDVYKCYKAVERLKSKRDMNLEHSRNGAFWLIEKEMRER